MIAQYGEFFMFFNGENKAGGADKLEKERENET